MKTSIKRNKINHHTWRILSEIHKVTCISITHHANTGNMVLYKSHNEILCDQLHHYGVFILFSYCKFFQPYKVWLWYAHFYIKKINFINKLFFLVYHHSHYLFCVYNDDSIMNTCLWKEYDIQNIYRLINIKIHSIIIGNFLLKCLHCVYIITLT